MATAEGKKRYYLTLTESNMEEFKQMLREFNAPPGLESVLVDEYIMGFVKHIAPAMRRAKELKKPLTLIDFFSLVGSVMQEVQDDEAQAKLL
jgi:hypothetical protein